MTLNVRSLDLLRVSIETRSVTATAERLHISQPAVSKAIQQAEQRLGFPLFVRERGRLVPTVDARVLLPEIIRALVAVESVSRLAEDLHGLKTGLITLAATPVLANALAASAIGQFRTLWAGVQVKIQTMFNHEVVEAVADHRVDLGLVLTPVEDRHTLARDLCAAELHCVMPRSHPLAGCKTVTPRDLAPFPLISFNRHEPIGAVIESTFRAAGIRRAIAVEVNQSATACALVEAGAGIVIVDGAGRPIRVKLHGKKGCLGLFSGLPARNRPLSVRHRHEMAICCVHSWPASGLGRNVTISADVLHATNRGG